MSAPAHITKKIDLGLSVLCAIKQPGESLTCKDIADVCDCTPQAISNIEVRALAKLRKKNHCIRDYLNEENIFNIKNNA